MCLRCTILGESQLMGIAERYGFTLLYAATDDTSLQSLCESFLFSDEVTPSADVPLAHSMSIRPCEDRPVGRHRFGFRGKRGNRGCERNEYRICGIITAEAYDISFGRYLHPQGLKRSDPQSADIFEIHIL